MPKHLVIVESPAKSQTIKKFLGADFEVKASYGHTVDLPTKGLWIDVQNDFRPEYVVSPDKKRVLSELKAISKKVDQTWIATDEDREGEAIWWHIANQLGLDIKTTPRIVFHEITKNAIEHAVKNPRTIDLNLVDAQQARRVLDRLVWFELSPVLWKKIKTWLSAWRVQSVAVKLIVEREREIQAFDSGSFYKVVWSFLTSANKGLSATLNKQLKSESETLKLLETLKGASYQVDSVEVKPWKKAPSAPFTTSTLQQEASRKLWFSVSRTMQVAQKLYEAGHITYMRTDAVNLSEFAIQAAKDQIISQYGEKYSKPTHYATKSKGAQEAHECIRPTHMENTIAGADASEKKLYQLIWKRTIASQMAPAVLEKTKAKIQISSTDKYHFEATGEVIKFDGFLKLYMEGTDNEDDEETAGMLPALNQWDNLSEQEILASQKFKQHPPRYTEASLVKKLEEQGIGRPSTYAPTISTILKRGYVLKEDRPWEKRKYFEFLLKNNEIIKEEREQMTWAEKQKMFPSDIGMIVTDFLNQNFSDIMDYGFTANVETAFDQIATGHQKRNQMIAEFYGPFHEQVIETTGKERVNTERELWIHPVSWKPVIARMGRYGPMIQIGKQDDEDKKFASLPAGKTIETITLDEALQAFALPRPLWTYNGEEVLASTGRFWPYVKYKNLYVSIKKDSGLDPFSISLDEAIPMIEAKITLEANKNINAFAYEGEEVQILNWPYGPYIKYAKKNYKIPKGWKDATDLSLEDCLKIIGIWEEWWSKPATKRPAAKKSTAKKTATKAKK